ncbi:MAG: zinc ABC transporter substrate-binding protein [Nitrospirae bacterium]|nr:zinc ABC transporter substrate-binding protein [Nitrospirota bacterium]
MKNRLGFVIFLLAVPCIIFAACQKKTDNADRGGKRLRILTTIPPLYSFTKNIAGSLADVENLLSSGAGPHEYSFTPADIRKAADSDILIKNGLGLERWLDSLEGSAVNDGLVIVDTSRGIGVMNNNPHIWLSPRNAIIQVKNIADALQKADPANSDAYAHNAEEYIGRLRLLDEEIKNAVSGWTDKNFISYHSAFLYFARDYGLNQAGVIEESSEKGPTPGRINDIINTARKAGIKAIFSEPGPQPAGVAMIADELGLKIYKIDTMERGDLSAAWYEEKIKANLLVMKMAFDKHYDTSEGVSK